MGKPFTCMCSVILPQYYFTHICERALVGVLLLFPPALITHVESVYKAHGVLIFLHLKVVQCILLYCTDDIHVQAPA